MLRDAVALKLEILSQGINFRPEFLSEYQRRSELIEKRRAYGSGDKEVLRDQRVPQEAILDGDIICALNHSPGSSWFLEFGADGPCVTNGEQQHGIRFPSTPRSYGVSLSNGVPLEKVATIYGNTTIGIFTPGHCFYFNDEQQCKFCSLGPARDLLSDHDMAISPQLAAECVTHAIASDPGRYRHVLINGGNIRDYDRGFARQVRIHTAIRELDLPPSIERHLISMPPKDFRLFESFAAAGGTLAMSLELFDREHFERLCPGKARDYGRDRFLAAFEAAVATIGRGKVYAGLVAGLEPLSAITEAIEFFGEMGAVPAVAVFHPDYGSLLVDHPRPTREFLQAVGRTMSAVYAKHSFRPFITGSGRNSLDTEAYLGGFA